MLTGWVCPVCGEANAPWAVACIRGPHGRLGVPHSTAIVVCDDCRRATSGYCPKHTTRVRLA